MFAAASTRGLALDRRGDTMLPVFAVFALVLAAAPPPEGAPRCAATAMITEAEANVAHTEDTRRLRAWLSYARNQAPALAAERDPVEAWQRCRELLLEFATMYAKFDPAAAQQARDAAAALALSKPIRPPAALAPPRPIKPPLTPEQQWQRRRRIIIANLTASAFFATAGLLTVTIPLIAVAACRADEPREYCGGDAGGGILTGTLGGSVLIASGIPLAVWWVRLHRHRQQRPVTAQLTGGGLRLAF